jgi:hypothetical protein
MENWGTQVLYLRSQWFQTPQQFITLWEGGYWSYYMIPGSCAQSCHPCLSNKHQQPADAPRCQVLCQPQAWWISAVGFAFTRDGGTTNHYAFHCMSSCLLKLLSGSTSDPLPLHNHLSWQSTTLTLLQGDPRLSEPWFFLSFQIPKVTRPQTLPDHKCLWLAGISWGWSTSPAMGLVLYFCCDLLARGDRATDQCGFAAQAPSCLNFSEFPCQTLTLSVTASHSHLLPRHCGQSCLPPRLSELQLFLVFKSP